MDRNPPRASERPRPSRACSLLRESRFRRAPTRDPSVARLALLTPNGRTEGEQEARRPREPLLPPLLPPEGTERLSPHGGDWLGRFLAFSSVPVSPASVAASKWFARRESRPAEVRGRGALREEPPSYRRPRYLSPWQAGSLEASSRPSPHAAPPTLPPDDSAFGTGLCEPCIGATVFRRWLGMGGHLCVRHRRLVWTTKHAAPTRVLPCDELPV